VCVCVGVGVCVRACVYANGRVKKKGPSPGCLTYARCNWGEIIAMHETAIITSSMILLNWTSLWRFQQQAMTTRALLPNAITNAVVLRPPDLPERRARSAWNHVSFATSTFLRLLHTWARWFLESWSSNTCLTSQRASVPKQSMTFGNNMSTWISPAVGDQLGIDLARVKRARSDANWVNIRQRHGACQNWFDHSVNA